MQMPRLKNDEKRLQSGYCCFHPINSNMNQKSKSKFQSSIVQNSILYNVGKNSTSLIIPT